MKNKNTLIIIAVVLIIVGTVGGFFAGTQYEKSQARVAFGQFAQGNSNGNGMFFQRTGVAGQMQQRNAYVPVRGQVLSLGDKTLTVKQQDGTTKIVVLGSSTAYLNTQKAALTDIKEGDTIMVIGNTNSDGSITASDVQINPQGFMRPSDTQNK